MAKTIHIFEHQKLLLGNQLTKPQLDRLYHFNDNNDNKYFTGIRNGIKFNSYVGVIQIGGQTIEILPKADNTEEGDKELWRDVLLRMLAVCRKIDLETVSDANLSKRHHSLLDLYFDRYLSELNKLLHKGLIKKYRFQIKNVNALKGQLQFGQHLQKNLVHKERFYTKHQTYDTEHLINQILLKALNILGTLVTNPFLIDRIKTLQLHFPEMKEIPIKADHFKRIQLNRKSQDYKEALQIAKMIILNYSPDLKGGNENMIALLFNMNSLWEEYIYRMLKKHNPEGFKILPQESQKFWETKTIRPDIVLSHIEKSLTYIIDTKWKVINNTEPSDADLKQMYAYNQYWKAKKSLLLYPQTANTQDNKGTYPIGIGGEHYCKLGFINVLDGKVLDQTIGEKIMKKLEGEWGEK